MDAHDELEEKSESFRKQLMALADKLSTLHNYSVRITERNRRKMVAYEARLDRIDRSNMD